jgi:CheY-like chemotaxis protein
MSASYVTFWFSESPKKRKSKFKMGIFCRIKNMKIQLVDDDEWIRDSLSLFFEAEGCNLLTFETAEEGMEAVKKQAYDIVISDYKLPGMDGL